MEFPIGDMTGGETGELTIVDDTPAGYGDIKHGEQEAMCSGDCDESAPRNVC